MSQPVAITFKELNAAKICENGFTFPFVNEHGDETKWLITVIGDQADTVKKAIYAKINKQRQHEKILEKRGKEVPVKPIEELINENAEGVAACIIGWSGIDVEYSPELAIDLVKNNKLIFDQVKAASENLANFTKQTI